MTADSLTAVDPLAPRLSVGPARGGWTLIIDPHFEFGDADTELRQWSLGGRVARLQLLEGENFSHATLWADGQIVWNASCDGELDEPSPESDPAHEIELVTGWRPQSAASA